MAWQLVHLFQGCVFFLMCLDVVLFSWGSCFGHHEHKGLARIWRAGPLFFRCAILDLALAFTVLAVFFFLRLRMEGPAPLRASKAVLSSIEKGMRKSFFK